MNFKETIDTIVQNIPYIGKWRKVYLTHSTPGNYDSPIPDIKFLQNNYNEFVKQNVKIKEIDLDFKHQLEIFLKLEKYFQNFNFPNLPRTTHRYYSNNIYYNLTDALILFSMILLNKPKRIIEVGSGFSSALMIDVNEMFFDNKLELLFIDPHPERLFSLLKKNEKINLIKEKIQFVGIDYFKQLNKNDILFIDSSHITKAFSDVNHLLFNILPELSAGTLIHFHDIHNNFEYPMEILDQGYYWNETYILRAFLMNNKEYSIELFNAAIIDLVKKEYNNFIKEYFLINQTKIFSGGFWLTKNLVES